MSVECIKGMTKNRHLAQSILDASWSKFFGMLSYKAASVGKIVKDMHCQTDDA